MKGYREKGGCCGKGKAVPHVKSKSVSYPVAKKNKKHMLQCSGSGTTNPDEVQKH